MSTASRVSSQLSSIEAGAKKRVKELLISEFPGGEEAYQDWLGVEVSGLGDLEDVLSEVDHLLAHITESANKWSELSLKNKLSDETERKLTQKENEEAQKDLEAAFFSARDAVDDLKEYINQIF